MAVAPGWRYTTTSLLTWKFSSMPCAVPTAMRRWGCSLASIAPARDTPAAARRDTSIRGAHCTACSWTPLKSSLMQVSGVGGRPWDRAASIHDHHAETRPSWASSPGTKPVPQGAAAAKGVPTAPTGPIRCLLLPRTGAGAGVGAGAEAESTTTGATAGAVGAMWRPPWLGEFAGGRLVAGTHRGTSEVVTRGLPAFAWPAPCLRPRPGAWALARGLPEEGDTSWGPVMAATNSASAWALGPSSSSSAAVGRGRPRSAMVTRVESPSSAPAPAPLSNRSMPTSLSSSGQSLT